MANKLYTEEQVRRIAKLYRHELYLLEAAINTEKPIQLPSDEEIVKNFTIGNTEYPHKIEGAKWLKDKILKYGK